MKPSTHSNRERNGKGSRPTPVVPFKVFIGYADVAAVRRAMCTIADAIRVSGRRIQLEPRAWRFAQLESSHWRDRAITAALDADVVVLASSERGEWSPKLEEWVSGFLVANRGRRATIVAVMGPADAWTISIEEPAAKLAQVPAPVAANALEKPEVRRQLVA